MCIAIKFFRVDAVLHENKFNVGDVEIGFFFEFATECCFRGFAQFSFATRNAPEIGPLGRANHQDAIGFIENQSADSDDGALSCLVMLRSGCQFEFVRCEMSS